MIKNVIIGLLTVVSLLSLTYGYVQKLNADEQAKIALENVRLAEEMRIRAEQANKEAELQRSMATLSAHKAIEQAAIAEKALEEARRKK